MSPADPERSGAWAARLGGHGWTLLSSLRGMRLAPPSWNWSAVIRGDEDGGVRLSGLAECLPVGGSEAVDDRPTVVIVHGLAGSAASGYVVRLVRAVVAQRWNALAINLRGADGSGEDIYHAGLGSDLETVFAAIPGAGPIFLVGYSLGGHLVLRYLAGACPVGGGRGGALVPVDSRVAGGAAVCAPLDLSTAVRVIDRAAAWPYRRYLLRRLNKLYRPVAERRGERDRWVAARRARRIRDWDELVVAPRFGFAGAEDYYRTVSVAPHLGGIAVPTLFIAARHDPMVPSEILAPHLGKSGALRPIWAERGGHVAIPGSALGLGEGSPERQIVAWLAESRRREDERAAIGDPR